jgi:ADP-heptose:LPS heptosyltransferase
MTVYLIGMHGLGDNIAQRPSVRALAKRHGEVYLETPYAFLYADIPGVKPVRRNSHLHKQAENEATDFGWHDAPQTTFHPVTLAYNQAAGNMHTQIATQLTVDLERMDLPLMPNKRAPSGRYAVIRPCTVRREWPNPARNCDPAYIEIAARACREKGLIVVLIASLTPKQEFLIGNLPEHDVWPHDLSTPDMLALVSGAEVAIGPPGWVQPAAIAARRPLLTIYGGRGTYHNPASDLPPYAQDDPKVRTLVPEDHCRCLDPYHQCNKHIRNAEQRIRHAIADLLA